jgi:hypothetical protein
MSRRGEPLTALDHMNPVRGSVGLHPGQLAVQMLQPLLFGEPFILAGIPLDRFGFAAGFTLRGRQRVRGGGGQPLVEGGDRRPQSNDVAVLGIARQAALIIIDSDDRVGPPCRGLPGQLLLPGVKPPSPRRSAVLVAQPRIHRFPT